MSQNMGRIPQVLILEKNEQENRSRVYSEYNGVIYILGHIGTTVLELLLEEDSFLKLGC